jgi:hypothetical protein
MFDFGHVISKIGHFSGRVKKGLIYNPVGIKFLLSLA